MIFLDIFSMTVTGDDILYVYDGGNQVLTHSDYSTVRTVDYASDPCVLAASAYNTANLGGILASTSTGVVTDASWKCSTVEETDWHLASFDDSDWGNAMIVRAQGEQPWFTTAGISSEANWIWADVTTIGDATTAYCRKRLC